MNNDSFPVLPITLPAQDCNVCMLTFVQRAPLGHKHLLIEQFNILCPENFMNEPEILKSVCRIPPIAEVGSIVTTAKTRILKRRIKDIL